MRVLTAIHKPAQDPKTGLLSPTSCREAQTVEERAITVFITQRPWDFVAANVLGNVLGESVQLGPCRPEGAMSDKFVFPSSCLLKQKHILNTNHLEATNFDYDYRRDSKTDITKES
eukprot:4463828-Amphidinium_carterae.1